jgi:surface antigen
VETTVESMGKARSLRTGLAAAGVLAAMLVGAGDAQARPICDTAGTPCPTGPKTAPGTVDVAAGWTLTVRAAPSSSAPKVRELQDGAKVQIVCQLRGDQVSGTFGTSRLWNKLIRGGYVSDTYVHTGSDGRVAPTCAEDGPTPNPQPQPQPQDKSKKRPRSVTLKDDYPFKSASPEEADPWAFFYRECTSFVAFRLNKLKNFKFHNLMQGGRFSDGGNWDDNARRLGFRVNRRPTVGSVMVRDSGTWGHVAIVAKVKRDKFLVEEYNHDTRHGYGQRWISRSPSSGEWDKFIHFRQ